MSEGTGCRHCNAKTLLSFDTTTVCAKARSGHPCIYCYVESARQDGWRPKSVIWDDKYDGWVRRLRPDTIKRLAAMGGLRMFAFGDYLAKHRPEIAKFLNDCQDRQVPVKAITKVIRFVRDWHDHPSICVLNVSIDNLKSGARSPISEVVALELRQRYRKVRVRAVCLSDEDVEHFAGNLFIDVLTLNHGRNGFKDFTVTERNKISAKYPGRVCCTGGVCDGCECRCGLGETALARR